MLLSVKSKRVQHDWATKLQQQGASRLSSVWPAPLYISTNSVWRLFFSPHPLWNLLFVDFFMFAILSDLRLYLTGVLIGVSLISGDA